MRVRFAPSPTGALHIGGARTALYNWLMARGSGGELLLRIEDTDRERSTPENVEQILDALRWLGIDWDGDPAFQTQHEARHRAVIQQLLAEDKAYRSHAKADDVKAYKAEHGADKGFRGADHPTRAAGDDDSAAVRLRVPEGETVVRDLIRGDTTFRNVHLDDPVIARGDGSPLYNLAVAIDDLDAGITHVVRGEDHLSNTPKQLLVYAALGAEAPVFAHLPLLHGPDGKKLSKRHGAASVQELRDAGYLPDAVINYLALLGWGDEDDETQLTREQLKQRFDVNRVSKNPARFDEQKLRWLNGKHLRAQGLDGLTATIAEHLRRSGHGDAIAGREELLRTAVEISQEKIQTVEDFWPLAGFLFTGPVDDPAAREKWLDAPHREHLAAARETLAGLDPFSVEAVDAALRALVGERGAKAKDVFQPVRVALAGTAISPGVFESAAALGRDETLRRIDTVLAG
ncbi:Glutamyl-tRNA synthetase [Patulibacter medicamentivorans]|uniref:Glutamate--tRNA ligase n=1 Tax=Patulibacter medicamentivorans TaxID=1097667 RepID=H0E0Z7_9ACTN|nr:glutamate--tRNA ligase [Patulibacter medicamentivorans]EHN12658.1 Glutamyl-tRNA synthetase [Patulibacter medicamentivorans]